MEHENNHNEPVNSQLDNLGIVIEEHRKEQEEHTQPKEFRLEDYKPSQRRLHPVILELIDHSISCKYDILSGHFHVDGFYKNGAMILEEAENGVLFSVDKKGIRTQINDLDDLVLLNYEHWKLAGGRNGNYPDLIKPWLDEFVDRGLVKRQVSYAPS